MLSFIIFPSRKEYKRLHLSPCPAWDAVWSLPLSLIPLPGPTLPSAQGRAYGKGRAGLRGQEKDGLGRGIKESGGLQTASHAGQGGKCSLLLTGESAVAYNEIYQYETDFSPAGNRYGRRRKKTKEEEDAKETI